MSPASSPANPNRSQLTASVMAQPETPKPQSPTQLQNQSSVLQPSNTILSSDRAFSALSSSNTASRPATANIIRRNHHYQKIPPATDRSNLDQSQLAGQTTSIDIASSYLDSPPSRGATPKITIPLTSSPINNTKVTVLSPKNVVLFSPKTS